MLQFTLNLRGFSSTMNAFSWKSLYWGTKLVEQLVFEPGDGFTDNIGQWHSFSHTWHSWTFFMEWEKYFNSQRSQWKSSVSQACGRSVLVYPEGQVCNRSLKLFPSVFLFTDYFGRDVIKKKMEDNILYFSVNSKLIVLFLKRLLLWEKVKYSLKGWFILTY